MPPAGHIEKLLRRQYHFRPQTSRDNSSSGAYVGVASVKERCSEAKIIDPVDQRRTTESYDLVHAYKHSGERDVRRVLACGLD